MSTFFSGITIVAVMEAMATAIGSPVQWMGTTDDQKAWLRRFPQYQFAVKSVPTVRAWASATAEPLNEILAGQGFTAKLKPWQSPNTFGLATTNDLSLLWKASGVVLDTKTNLPLSIDGHPAFRLKVTSDMGFYLCPGFSEPIVWIETKNGDRVCMVKHPVKRGTFSVVEAVEKIYSSTLRRTLFSRFSGVQIPMVSLEMESEPEWLEGLVGVDRDSKSYYIGQTIQQSILGMNQYGLRVKEAMAAQILTRSGGDYYLLDEPFLLWIERPRVKVPLALFQVTKEHWSDPGDLSTL